VSHYQVQEQMLNLCNIRKFGPCCCSFQNILYYSLFSIFSIVWKTWYRWDSNIRMDL